MANVKKVLVVGTTADYVSLLNECFPGRVIFITDFEERAKHKGTIPDGDTEIVLDLDDYDAVVRRLQEHVQRCGLDLSGVACFDCESMALAALAAQTFGLPFQSLDTVIKCRSKYQSKSIWKKHGIFCPDSALVRSREDALKFFESSSGPVVLKPLTGSGSELIFLCETRDSCSAAYGMIAAKLQGHFNRRMYSPRHMPLSEDPRRVIAAEQYIPGDEYSCDFMFDEGRAKILRLAKKYLNQHATFGSMLAYDVPAQLPEPPGLKVLEGVLQQASESLEFKRTIAMADFKIWAGRVYLLEITPRPGGDCLPHLIRASCGFDILGAWIDFVEGRQVNVPPSDLWQRVIGLHLMASQEGILEDLDISALERDPRVVQYSLKLSKGDVVKLPPDDYDSRLLGYVIFRPFEGDHIEQQCREIARKVVVQIGSIWTSGNI